MANDVPVGAHTKEANAEATTAAAGMNPRLRIMPDPIGSHILPEDVIEEEACEHLEQIWDSQWQGTSVGMRKPYACSLFPATSDKD